MASRLLHNFWLKIFSLGLATMIWVTIHIGITRDFELTNPNPTQAARKSVILPISIIAQPGEGRVFKITPSDAKVTIVGEDAFVRRMGRNDIKVYVDLTNVKSGGITTNEVHPDAPREVTITDLSPTYVEVEQISP